MAWVRPPPPRLRVTGCQLARRRDLEIPRKGLELADVGGIAASPIGERRTNMVDVFTRSHAWEVVERLPVAA